MNLASFIRSVLNQYSSHNRRVPTEECMSIRISKELRESRLLASSLPLTAGAFSRNSLPKSLHISAHHPWALLAGCTVLPNPVASCNLPTESKRERGKEGRTRRGEESPPSDRRELDGWRELARASAVPSSFPSERTGCSQLRLRLT